MRPAYRNAGLVLLIGGSLFLSPAGREHKATAAEVPRGSDARSSYQLRLGAHVYHRYCETCHGKEGRGDGFNAFNLDPKPRDVAAAAFQRTSRDLLDAIAHGGASAGLSPAMPPWGKTLSTREKEAVVAYLRELARAQER